MKNYLGKAHRYVILFFVCGTLVIFAASCHKDAFTSGSPTGTFYFRLYNQIYTHPADSVAPYFYFDSTGRYISLKVPQFFISGVSLITSGGSAISMSGLYILTDLDSSTYIIGSAPQGTYASVSFTVGLDAGADGEAPYLFTPLGSVTSATMYYNDSQGYMAMKVQGLYDTTSVAGHVGSGLNPVNFSFDIPNTLEQTITMPLRGTTAYPMYSLSVDSVRYIDIVCDYGRLLSALNLKTQYYTDGISTRIGIADTLSAEIPNMFYYKD